MRIVEQDWRFSQKPNQDALRKIEEFGRICYQSQDKITTDSSHKFVSRIISNGHESVIEHVSVSVEMVTCRSVTHELVRHRLCSFSQESTRYVNYQGSIMEFIRPVWLNVPVGEYRKFGDIIVNETGKSFHCRSSPELALLNSFIETERLYKDIVASGIRPDQAREILPGALKTMIVMTANMRQWRHIFRLRTSTKAHPQIRDIMKKMLVEFKKEFPVLFDDI